MVALTIEGLSVTLGRRAGLRDISLKVTGGEMVGVIGPNGAGKSTLLRAMLGLVIPDRGGVAIDGKQITSLPRRDLARRIAYLPQGQTIHWPITVERLVSLGRLPHLAPLSRVAAEDLDAIERAMTRADVAQFRERAVTELSGGERARVLLARALAVGAPVLLIDEPLAALDLGHQIDVMALLQREAAAGTSVIVVLHDLGIAARYCQRLILLDHGTLIAEGAPLAVLTSDRLRSVYGITADITGGTITPTGRVDPPISRA